MSDRSFFDIGLTLVLLGFAMAVVAALLMVFHPTKGTVRGGGAVIIGPLPIIFGSDKGSLRGILVIAIILFLIVLGVTLIPFIRGR